MITACTHPSIHPPFFALLFVLSPHNFDFTWGTGTMTPSLGPRMVVRSTIRTASLAPLVRKMLSGFARWPSRRSMKSHTYWFDDINMHTQ